MNKVLCYAMLCYNFGFSLAVNGSFETLADFHGYRKVLVKESSS